MPLTPIQKDILHLLAAQRQPESHLAGGTAINRSPESPRFSADIDFFHDLAESIHATAQADADILTRHGFDVAWLQRQPFLQRASIQRGGESLKLEWCYDSAFRFFPVQPDAEFGYCLHPADLATNKALALAGRAEIRDFIDILFLHDTYLSLGAICWAACGKDQGYCPRSLLDFAKRNMKFRGEDLARENLAKPLGLPQLKNAWNDAVAQAEQLFAHLPLADVGCLYLTPDFSPFTPDTGQAGLAAALRHFGSLRGAWPTLA